MKTVHILKSDIDAILDTDPTTRRFAHQSDAIVALYKLIYPDWDQIDHINGFPQCHPATGEYIMLKFIAFDRVNHPNVINGGLWLNNGWGTIGNKDLHEFEVAP